MTLNKTEKYVLIGLLLILFFLVGIRYFQTKTQQVELSIIPGEDQVVQR